MQNFNDILFWHENIFKVDHLKQVYLTKLTDDARKKKPSAINNSTKTIITEDLTCDPEDKEKSRRYWLSLTGIHCSMNIADKDVMYNKPVTDRIVNFAQQLLKRISFQVNDFQDCCYVPVEIDSCTSSMLVPVSKLVLASILVLHSL